MQKSKMFRNFLLTVIAVMSMHTAHAQHATAFDIVDGKQAFQLYCASCHGPDGDLVAGVDLGHNQFRQPYTDEQIATIIRNGIDGKPMPPSPTINQEQALQIVAYLRSLDAGQDAAAGGDARRGRALFEGKGACLSCHRVAGSGSRIGPDLSTIALRRTAAELEVSLRDPRDEVQANSRFVAMRLVNAEVINGRLLNQDVFSVQILDTNERLRSISKDEIEHFEFIPSIMPAYEGVLTDQEIADLVAYQTTLRGAP